MSQNIFNIDKLDNNNFDTWKVLMENILIHNDSWGYVSGSKEKPRENPQEQEKWEVADRKTKALIILSVQPSQLIHVKNCVSAKEVWQKLQEVHQPQGPGRKVALIRQLVQIKLEDSDGMQDHINMFFQLTDKLKEVNIVVPEEFLSILLLCSLPNDFETFRVAIESRDSLPSLESLKLKILEEFEHRNRYMVKPLSQDVLIANTERPKNLKKKKFLVTCFICKKKGHMSYQCTKNKTAKGKANTVIEHSEESSGFSAFILSENDNSLRGTWCLDSGATSHMCNDRNSFTEFTTTENQFVKMANEECARIEGKGTVEIKVRVNKVVRTIQLLNVLFVPKLRGNLLSVAKMTNSNIKVIFDNQMAIGLSDDGDTIVKAEKKDALYIIKEIKEETKVATSNSNDIKTWHERFGHLNFDTLRNLCQRQMVIGLNMDTKGKSHLVCSICIQGKQTCTKYPKISQTRSKELLEVIHSDICGPMKNVSLGGARYFVTFIDDMSRKIDVFLLKKKSDVLDAFKEYKSYSEKQSGRQIKYLRTDNGGEYCSREFDNFLKINGIQRQLTAAYTPQQNSVAERANRTLVESARCMLLQAKLPVSFWGEAIATASYLRNRSATKVLNDKTPYEVWHGKKPNVFFFKIFGSTAFVLDKSPGNGKFDAKSHKCIFVGYFNDAKAYRLWDPIRKKIIKSRDVRFVENIDQANYEINSKFQLKLNNEKIAVNDNLEEEANIPKREHYEEIVEMEEEIENNVKDGKTSERYPEYLDGDTSDNEITENNIRKEISKIDKRRENITTRRGPGRPKIVREGKVGRPRKEYRTFESSNEVILSELDPVNAKEALQGENAKNWKHAMDTEFKSLTDNKTWELVDLPVGRTAIGCKWVLKTKYAADGSIEKFKARLVAKGYAQKEGVDFFETFSPVVRISSIRILLAMAVDFKMIVHQMDVSTAYLNGDLHEEIYMHQPEFYEKMNEENKVCKLRKSLYGLRQSGREWYRKLDSRLKEIEFARCSSDQCMYVKRSREDIIIIAVYVDDLIIATTNSKLMTSIKSELQMKFKMKDGGPLHYCLGIEFEQDENGSIKMSQRKYSADILKRFGMENCKSISSPLDSNSKWFMLKEGEEVDTTLYQSMIGSLMYLATSTRPDISYSVSALSQFSKSPKKQHLVAVKRVFRYIKGTLDIGLHFKQTREPLIGFTDADWGGNLEDRKSYTGFVFKLAGAAVSWQARKQKSVALSSTESEYMALTESTKEAIYLRNFLKELQYFVEANETINIFNDNQGAQKLIKNNIFHSRTKHIDIQYHFIREAFENKIIDVSYMSTEDMPADVLTKGLNKVKHARCMHAMGLQKL